MISQCEHVDAWGERVTFRHHGSYVKEASNVALLYTDSGDDAHIAVALSRDAAVGAIDVLTEAVELWDAKEAAAKLPVLQRGDIVQHPNLDERYTVVDAPLYNGGWFSGVRLSTGDLHDRLFHCETHAYKVVSA